MEARPARPGLRRNPDTGCNDLQEAFARLVAETNTLTEAYIRVYYLGQGKDPGNAKPETIYNRAYICSRKPNVLKRIEHWQGIVLAQRDKELQTKLDGRQSLVKAEELTNEKIRSFIRETAFSIAQSDDSRHSDRLKAMELLGKLAGVGAFEKVADNPTDQDESKAKQKLRELIDHLRQTGKLAVLPSMDSAKPLEPTPKPLQSNDKQ